MLTLNAAETELKKQLKEAETELDNKAYNQYPKLTEADIKTLAVAALWLDCGVAFSESLWDTHGVLA